MQFDVLRLRARLASPKSGLLPVSPMLHIACGSRRIPGWLNVDVVNSEQDVDLAAGRLPWRDGSFQVAVGEHFVEHLDLEDEFIPFLRELRRVMAGGGEVWLSCPDLEKVCTEYVKDRGRELLAEVQRHRPLAKLPEGCPPQHFVNRLFHQGGEHKNLYDFEILRWALGNAGFVDCVKVQERDLLDRFPGFPPRHDDHHTIYVRASVP
jgi:predicted SAM-dependent methyltransferase